MLESGIDLTQYAATLHQGEMGKRARSTGVAALVHGDEISGPVALRDARADVELLRNEGLLNGSVLWTFGNPWAAELGQPWVEYNLNRLNRDDIDEAERNSYEGRQATRLQNEVLTNGVTVLLDLHSSSTKDSFPMLITQPKGFRLAAHLDVDTVITNLDPFERGGTDYWMNRQRGKVGMCLEAGYHKDPRAVEVAYNAVHSLLIARGHYKGIKKIIDRPQLYYEVVGVHRTQGHYVPEADIAASRELHFVRQGHLLGRDDGKPVFAPRDGHLLFSTAERTNRGDEAVVFTVARPDLTIPRRRVTYVQPQLISAH